MQLHELALWTLGTGFFLLFVAVLMIGVALMRMRRAP